MESSRRKAGNSVGEACARAETPAACARICSMVDRKDANLSGTEDAPLIAIGSDHAGFSLKESLKARLEGSGYRVWDVGTDSETSCDYPDFGLKVAEAVAGGQAARGMLVCGSGIGMAMVANKVPGVRAAVCNDLYCAEYGRRHNDANVLTIGARVVSADEAARIVDVFLETDFEGEGESGARHLRRIKKIRGVEVKYNGR